MLLMQTVIHLATAVGRQVMQSYIQGSMARFSQHVIRSANDV